MKCAMELMTVATVRAEEIKIEEAIRKEREAKEKRERTIAYCERLGNLLESKANAGKIPETNFVCSSDGCLLSATTSDYADRRISYNKTKVVIDFALMAEWFAQYCFEVNLRDFEYWYYGCGKWHGYNVIIRPKPVCIG